MNEPFIDGCWPEYLLHCILSLALQMQQEEPDKGVQWNEEDILEQGDAVKYVSQETSQVYTHVCLH